MSSNNMRVPVRVEAKGSVKPSLIIISTYDEFCGISGYTRALEQQLHHDFDLTVLELDQYLLRSPHPRVQKQADQHIRNLAAQLHGADCVNIQLEHGTLGRTPKQIIRRFGWLVKAAPQMSVTFHTIMPAAQFDWAKFWGKIATFRFLGAKQFVKSYRRSQALNIGIYGTMIREARHKPVRAITHTRRDMRLLRDVFGLREVYDHPLSFVTPEERRDVEQNASRKSFPIASRLPPEAKLIGTFGFLSPYKGFDTVVKALRHLPDDYHLLIFGGIHPQTIKQQAPIDLYIKDLLNEAYIDRNILEEVMENKGARTNVSISIDGNAEKMIMHHPKTLAGRVHFMGALNDKDFLSAMAVCDAVVLPYLEVGQSASGPITQALEMNRRILASRTNAFMQFARYHPDMIEFFDIGNHLQLAEMLVSDPQYNPQERHLAYDWESNRSIYYKASTGRQINITGASA